MDGILIGKQQYRKKGAELEYAESDRQHSGLMPASGGQSGFIGLLCFVAAHYSI